MFGDVHTCKKKKTIPESKVGRQDDEGTDGKEADWGRGGGCFDDGDDDYGDEEDDGSSGGKLP